MYVIVYCSFMKSNNQKAHAPEVLIICDCFFTLFTQQIVLAVVLDVINIDIQRQTR